MTKLCEFLRTAQGLTKTAVATAARLGGPSQCLWIEQGRWIPYPPELARLAAALGYEGDPADLLKDVEELVEVPDGPAA